MASWRNIRSGILILSDEESRQPPTSAPASGVALFMVIAAVAMLSVLITEFTYVASINQKMAFDSLDMVKAHYLAKSGFKLSLLRLKAYQQVKGLLANAQGGGDKAGNGAAAGAVPKGILEKIWSFPFAYPFPTNIPGISLADKESISKFEKDSNLEGKFSAFITSESSKYNLNRILSTFATVGPSPSPSASPSANPAPGSTPTPTPTATPSTAPSFSPEEARKNLTDYLTQILNNKFESDQDFASEHRDFRIEDLMDNIFAWADRSYERKQRDESDKAAIKRMPFNSLSEMHMIPPLTDELFDLFAPTLTVSSTPGININTMEEPTLKALVPQMTKEEITEFFKFRDSQEEDNLFKSDEDFFKYLLNSVQAFRHDQAEVNRFKEDLNKRVRLVTEETEFKITVQATVNQSTRLIEAWVTLGQPKASTGGGGGSKGGKNDPNNPPAGNPVATDSNGAPAPPDAGLKITYMRIL